VAVLSDVDSWNPYTSRDATSARIVDLLYPRLLRETDGGFEPWLARSWSVSSDGLRVTFHLEPAAVWSDGAPVTCEDVRFTHRAQTSPALNWAGAPIKRRLLRVECPDPRTVVFLFLERYPDQLVDANDDAIVPRAYADVPFAEWATTAWAERLISCGPFRLAAVRQGQEAVLDRDPDWWRAPQPWIDRVVFRVHPEALAALHRFMEGEIDLLVGVPPLRTAEIAAQPGLRVVDLPSLSYTFLGWNRLVPGAYSADRKARGCRPGRSCPERREDILRLQRERPHPILADPRVRLALSLAIDRQDLVAGLWAGRARVGSSPVVSGSWAHDPGTSLPFDRESAMALLDQAGWVERDRDGVRRRGGQRLELRVILSAENTMRRDALERIAAGLSDVGVRIESVPLPRQEFVARARDKDFDGVLSGWSAGTRIEPWNLLHTDAALDRGNNLGAWSTLESDTLLERARQASGRGAARVLWLRWQALFREQQPLSILYEERRLLGLHARVQGPDPTFLDPFGQLHAWWLVPAQEDR